MAASARSSRKSRTASRRRRESVEYRSGVFMMNDGEDRLCAVRCVRCPDDSICLDVSTVATSSEISGGWGDDSGDRRWSSGDILCLRRGEGAPTLIRYQVMGDGLDVDLDVRVTRRLVAKALPASLSRTLEHEEFFHALSEWALPEAVFIVLRILERVAQPKVRFHRALKKDFTAARAMTSGRLPAFRPEPFPKWW